MRQKILLFTVLKHARNVGIRIYKYLVLLELHLPLAVLKQYYNRRWAYGSRAALQQYLPLVVCDKGGETAEERSDDEVRTSLVPDRGEGKTKRIEWMCLLLAVLKLVLNDFDTISTLIVATVLTACGMRRRVRGSRGAKWRWGPHISSPWPKGRENEKDGVNVLTVYGIETVFRRMT